MMAAPTVVHPFPVVVPPMASAVVPFAQHHQTPPPPPFHQQMQHHHQQQQQHHQQHHQQHQYHQQPLHPHHQPPLHHPYGGPPRRHHAAGGGYAPYTAPHVFAIVPGSLYHTEPPHMVVRRGNGFYHYVRPLRDAPYGAYCLLSGCNRANGCPDDFFYRQRQQHNNNNGNGINNAGTAAGYQQWMLDVSTSPADTKAAATTQRRNDTDKSTDAGQQQRNARPKSAASNSSSSSSTVSKKLTAKQLKQQQQKQGSVSASNVSEANGGGASFPKSWLFVTAKGHSSQVCDAAFSASGQYLASCSEDRTILVWNWTTIDTQRRCQRLNIDFDFAARIAWHPTDDGQLFAHKSLAQRIEPVAVIAPGTGSTSDTKSKKNAAAAAASASSTAFERAHSLDGNIVGMGSACTGNYLMSCSSQSEFVLWSLDGEQLDRIDTCLGNNHAAKVSRCGRFVAVCGFSPDVKVWEVKFKAGKYVRTVNVFNLSGHTSGIYDLDFDQDTSNIATVSKDGTWKVFSTNIDYERGQLPRCSITGKYNAADFEQSALIAISGTGQVVAIGTGRSVQLFSALDGRRDAQLNGCVDGEASIVRLFFTPHDEGAHLLVVGDRQVRCFHNVTGLRVRVQVLRKRLEAATTSATRDRLQAQIAEDVKRLVAFEG